MTIPARCKECRWYCEIYAINGQTLPKPLIECEAPDTKTFRCQFYCEWFEEAEE